MMYILFFLLLYAGVVISMPLITLDPVVIDQNPVSNSQFLNAPSHLYGTNVVGHYKWISNDSSFQRDVFVENINDTKPRNILYCPRTDQNPFMALYIHTSTNGRLVCKEKYANYPLRLFCEPNLSHIHKCSNLYPDRKPLMSDETSTVTTTGVQTEDLQKISTTSLSADDPKFAPALPDTFSLNSHVLLSTVLIVSLITCVFLLCFCFFIFVVIFTRTNLFNNHKTEPAVANAAPAYPARSNFNQLYFCARCQKFFTYPHYCPEQTVVDPFLRNDG